MLDLLDNINDIELTIDPLTYEMVLTFDNIYHEHVNYWSLTTLITFFFIMSVAEKIKTHIYYVFIFPKIKRLN